MITIRGIYDGKKFVPLEEFSARKKYKVMITFLEEIDEDDYLENQSQ